jgi:hypothetical protein
MAYPLFFCHFFGEKLGDLYFFSKDCGFHEKKFVKKITLGIPIYAHIVHIPLHPTFY